jgi:phage replication O-like protein O
MNNPQKENGYTSTANEIMDYLCGFRIPGEVRQIVDCVLRKTYGWNKKEDQISNSQLVIMTKMTKGNVSRALSKAITHKLVIKSDNKLKLNKHYDEWISFEKSVIKNDNKVIKSDTEVIKSDNKKLSKVRDTKDNTKDTIQKTIVTNVTTGFGNPDINDVSSYFLKVFQIPKEDCTVKQSRMYWNHLLRESKTKVSGVKWLIDRAYEDEFYKNNITSSKDLYYKRIKIIARKRGAVPTIAVMGGGDYGQKMETNNWDRTILLN